MGNVTDFTVPGEVGQKVENIPASVEQYLYSNSETGFAVMRMRHAPEGSVGNGSLFTATGIMGDLQPKERLFLSGVWEENKKFGIQFKVTALEFPDFSGTGVYEFLIGEFVKGITPRIGEQIWAKFGEQTVSIFENDPDRLLEIKGIGPAKLQGIVASWRESANRRVALNAFAKMKLHSGIIQRIFNKWANPEYALEIIQANPYRLAWDIPGVGFKAADVAAKALGFENDDFMRLSAGIGFVLHEAAKGEGHCFLERSDLFNRSENVLGVVDRQRLSAALETIVEEERVILVEAGESSYVYLANIESAERNLAIRLGRFTDQKFPSVTHLNTIFTEYERLQRISLDAKQKEALQLALENQVAVITGGPGTGKTTIIKALLDIFQRKSRNARVALCAPTGRAAKRMSESSGYEASTIHRLLGFTPGEGFAYNTSNPLPYDIVICDESSMLDVFLANSLVGAVPPSARIIFVGDVNQLPSVGAGAVLRDIIKSGCVPTCYLSRIYRQSEGSFIAHNANAILNGDIHNLNLSNKTDDFFWMGIQNQRLAPDERQGKIKQGVLAAVNRLLVLGYSVNDIQILCPMYKGEVGVEALNKLLQRVFNPSGMPAYVGHDRQFLIGDKVMQTRNNYDKDVFNGDQGTLVAAFDDTFVVDFDGQEVAYEKKELTELVLAYAMTIHKAQGSEAKAVIQIVSTAHHIMLQRSILYTGVTRARNICVLIGENAALKKAVECNVVAQRNTYLAERIKESEKLRRLAA